MIVFLGIIFVPVFFLIIVGITYSRLHFILNVLIYFFRLFFIYFPFIFHSFFIYFSFIFHLFFIYFSFILHLFFIYISFIFLWFLIYYSIRLRWDIMLLPYLFSILCQNHSAILVTPQVSTLYEICTYVYIWWGVAHWIFVFFHTRNFICTSVFNIICKPNFHIFFV